MSNRTNEPHLNPQDTDEPTAMSHTEDLGTLMRDTLVRLVSDQSKELFNKYFKNIINEFQSEYETSLHNGTLPGGQYSDQELEQMSVEELERLKAEYKSTVAAKKDTLLNQLTLRNRLMERLIRIFDLLDRNHEQINQFLNGDRAATRLTGQNDLSLDEYADRWSEERQKIENKFEQIDQLMDELKIPALSESL